MAKYFHAFLAQTCVGHNQVVQIHAERAVLSPTNSVEVGFDRSDHYYAHLILVLYALEICLLMTFLQKH
jgi:hypothetical protein